VATAVETANREVHTVREAQNVVEERRPSFFAISNTLPGSLTRYGRWRGRWLAKRRACPNSVSRTQASQAPRQMRSKSFSNLMKASDRVTQLSPIAAEHTQLSEALSQLKLDQQRYQAGLGVSKRLQN